MVEARKLDFDCLPAQSLDKKERAQIVLGLWFLKTPGAVLGAIGAYWGLLGPVGALLGALGLRSLLSSGGSVQPVIAGSLLRALRITLHSVVGDAASTGAIIGALSYNNLVTGSLVTQPLQGCRHP